MNCCVHSSQESLLTDSSLENEDYGSNDERQAAPCTNSADLEQRLSDNLVLNESEMRLRENCRLFGLKFGTKTKINGDCFFEAVCAQLNSKRLKDCSSIDAIQVKTPEQLREDVVKHLCDKYKKSDDRFKIQSCCTKMKKEGTFADPLVLLETAQMLETDIVVVTSSFSSSPQQNVFWIVGKSDFNGEPLLLGHYCKKYYQSLEPINETKNNSPKPTKQRVTEMREAAIKDFICICHEEIRLDDESIETLEKGDHISRPAKCCCGYTHLCFHHAILEADIPKNHQNPNVAFKFISFSESNEGKAKINTVSETLNYKEMDIYKIDYKHPKYKGEQVTGNVSKLMGNDIPYHLFLNNCEHICRGCATGEEKSIQVDTLDECCAKSVFGCLPRLLRLVLAIIATVLDDLYYPNRGWIIGIQSFALAVYSYLLLRQLTNSRFMYSLKKMCKKCLMSSSRNFLFGFVFIILSVIGIIFDDVTYDKRIAYALAGTALSVWFITELCNVCSERCRRTTTRCICCILTCCCHNECFKAICCKCCKCHTCSKCYQRRMDCVDPFCHGIVDRCSSCLRCCCQHLRRRC